MSLIDLYDKMIAKAIQENIYTSRTPYPNFSGDTASDPLIAANLTNISTNIDTQQYTQSRPYERSDFNKNLRFVDGNMPGNVAWADGSGKGIPEQGNLTRLNEYNERSQFAPIAAQMPLPGLGVTDIFAIANWAKNIAYEFGIISRKGATQGEQIQNQVKGLTFLGTQFALAAFNPTDPQYGGALNASYNPLHLAASAIPLLRSTPLGTSPNAAAAVGSTYRNIQSALPKEADRHLLMRQGVYKKGVNASDVANLNFNIVPGFIGDVAKPGGITDTLDGGDIKIPGVQGLSIEAQVDKNGPLGKLALAGNYQTNLFTEKSPYSLQNPGIDLEYIETVMEENPSLTAEQIQLQALFKGSTLGSLGTFLPNVKLPVNQYEWPASFNPSLMTEGIDLSSPTDYSAQVFTQEIKSDDATIPNAVIPTDDAQYMPFSFEDLRETIPSTLFFRAFLKDGIQESFNPRWQSQNYYGRVDEVASYVATSRNISFEFDVVAWSPVDLKVVWKKLHKLQSMVYPVSTTDNFLKTGPIIRLRIGDLVCASSANQKGSAGKKGLPGYISALSFAYDDDVWNIRKDFKIPRKIAVSISFVVIHEGNPVLYPKGTNNVFGCLEFRDNSDVSSIAPGDVRGIVDTISDSSFANLSDALGGELV